jgi:hypothetical protein
MAGEANSGKVAFVDPPCSWAQNSASYETFTNERLCSNSALAMQAACQAVSGKLSPRMIATFPLRLSRPPTAWNHGFASAAPYACGRSLNRLTINAESSHLTLNIYNETVDRCECYVYRLYYHSIKPYQNIHTLIYPRT